MKKIVMLSAAIVFGMSSIGLSQAETTEVESAEPATTESEELVAAEAETMDSAADADSDTEVASDDAVEESAEATAAVEEEPIPEDPPQVQKLVALYPKLVQRIEPYAKVCFPGEDCDITVMSAGGSADGEPRDGKAVYDAVCQTCHATGLIGSPKLGDSGAWGPRIAKGSDTLYDHAINGFNAMPAKGGADIPDEEVINAVDFMISESS